MNNHLLSSHQNIFTCKQYLICARFSPIQMRGLEETLESIIMIRTRILTRMMFKKSWWLTDYNCFSFDQNPTYKMAWCLWPPYSLLGSPTWLSYLRHPCAEIHCWVSDVMLYFSKSVPMKKQTDVLGVSIFSAKFHFWVNYSFNIAVNFAMIKK